MEAAAHGSRLAHDWLSASLEVKQRSRGASFAGSRPGSARLHADGRSHFLSPRQEKWEDLEGDEVLVEEDEDGSSIADLASEDSERERREIQEALLAEQLKRDPLWGGYEIDPTRPTVLSECQPAYTGGARREDLDIVAAVTDAALSGRDDAGGVDGAGREGKWAAVLVNGCEYEGEWRGGLMHGRGTLRWPDGTTYTGDLCRARITGEGSYYYSTGVEYHGQVLEGERHGEGLMVVPRPRFARYMGAWRRGKRHGHGVLRLDEEDESFYEGEWQDDRRHGFGVMVYANGNRYEGEWCKDERQGQGCMHWRDLCEIYEGQWWAGKQHGSGEHVWYPAKASSAPPPEVNSSRGLGGSREGGRSPMAKSPLKNAITTKQVLAESRLLTSKGGGAFSRASLAKQPLVISPFMTRNYYRGEWVNGLREGMGSFEYADGSRFRGAWLCNEKHGPGVFVSADGRVEEGSWAHDRKVRDDLVDETDAFDYVAPRGKAGAAEERREKLRARLESVQHQRPDRNIILHIDDVVASQVDSDAEVRRVKNSLLQHWHELKALFASLLSARASSLVAAAGADASTGQTASSTGPGQGEASAARQPISGAPRVGGRGLPLGSGAAGLLQGAGGRIWLSEDEVAGFVRKSRLLDVRLGQLVVHNILQRVWDRERQADVQCAAATPKHGAPASSSQGLAAPAPGIALSIRGDHTRAARAGEAAAPGGGDALASRQPPLGDGSMAGPHRVVLFRQFLEALVRVAAARFSELECVSARIDHCLFHHILPLVPQEAKVAAEPDDRGRQKPHKAGKERGEKKSETPGAKSRRKSAGTGNSSPSRASTRRRSVGGSRVGSPLKSQREQAVERAEAVRWNFDGLRQVFVALARDGARGVVLRDVCSLLLSCGIICSRASQAARFLGAGGESGASSVLAEEGEDRYALDEDEWGYTGVVCKLLAVDLNLRDTDAYILENAANIDVHLSFVELTDGLVRLAADLPYGGVREGFGDQLALLLERLLAEIDRKRAVEERKREELIAGLLADAAAAVRSAADVPGGRGGGRRGRRGARRRRARWMTRTPELCGTEVVLYAFELRAPS